MICAASATRRSCTSSDSGRIPTGGRAATHSMTKRSADPAAADDGSSSASSAFKSATWPKQASRVASVCRPDAPRSRNRSCTAMSCSTSPSGDSVAIRASSCPRWNVTASHSTLPRSASAIGPTDIPRAPRKCSPSSSSASASSASGRGGRGDGRFRGSIARSGGGFQTRYIFLRPSGATRSTTARRVGAPSTRHAPPAAGPRPSRRVAAAAAAARPRCPPARTAAAAPDAVAAPAGLLRAPSPSRPGPAAEGPAESSHAGLSSSSSTTSNLRRVSRVARSASSGAACQIQYVTVSSSPSMRATVESRSVPASTQQRSCGVST